jgi:ADP-heptose:LPS heptosyltransferase
MDSSATGRDMGKDGCGVMGYGDEIIATGLARGAHERGKRIAFGDGRQIRSWKGWARQVFLNNPNIALPGSEGAKDLQWIKHYKGHRLTGHIDPVGKKIIFNHNFHSVPGEFFFDNDEQSIGATYGDGFIVIEPNVRDPSHANKDWGFEKYKTVAAHFLSRGYRVIQFIYPGADRVLDGAEIIQTPFRISTAIMQHARLYVGPEGAMHHAAAALGINAVVLFGGLVPVTITGYKNHVNLTGGSDYACGNMLPCAHCRKAMNAISVDTVIAHAMDKL